MQRKKKARFSFTSSITLSLLLLSCNQSNIPTNTITKELSTKNKINLLTKDNKKSYDLKFIQEDEKGVTFTGDWNSTFDIDDTDSGFVKRASIDFSSFGASTGWNQTPNTYGNSSSIKVFDGKLVDTVQNINLSSGGFIESETEQKRVYKKGNVTYTTNRLVNNNDVWETATYTESGVVHNYDYDYNSGSIFMTPNTGGGQYYFASNGSYYVYPNLGGGWQYIESGNNSFIYNYYSRNDCSTTNSAYCPFVSIGFYGTNIEVFGRKGPDFGKVNLELVDGTNTVVKRIDNVDLSASDFIADQSLGKFENLPYKLYNVFIKPVPVDPSNPYFYIFDFQKAKTLPDSMIEYTFSSEHTVGYKAVKGPDMGIVKVSLDGGVETEIDLYSPTVKGEYVKIYENIDYNTNHKLVIKGTHQKNPNSTGYKINVDTFGRLPSLSGSINSAKEKLLLNYVKGPTYGKLDLYLNNVFHSTIDQYSPTYEQGSTLISGLTVGSSQVIKLVSKVSNLTEGKLVNLDSFYNFNPTRAVFNFKTNSDSITNSQLANGQASHNIEIHSVGGNNQGKMKVTLDNNPPQFLDLYSSNENAPKDIKGLTFPNISAGAHTVTIEPNYTKNILSTGYGINIDEMAFFLSDANLECN